MKRFERAVSLIWALADLESYKLIDQDPENSQKPAYCEGEKHSGLRGWRDRNLCISFKQYRSTLTLTYGLAGRLDA